MSNGFTYRGVHISTFNAVLIACDEETADVDIQHYNRPYYVAGGLASRPVLGAKRFKCAMIVSGDDSDVLNTKLTLLLGLLSPSAGENYLKFDHYTDRQFVAVVDSSARVARLGSNVAQVEVSFMVPSGFGVALVEQSGSIVDSKFPPSGTVAGSAIAPAIITIAASSTGSYVQVYCADTGRTARLNRNIASNDQLIFNGVTGEVTHNSVNVESALTAGSLLPALLGGIQNTITITGVTCTATCTVRGRFA